MFKVGDKVKRIGGSYSGCGMTHGEIYTVSEITSASKIKVEGMPDCCWNPSNFELIEKPEPFGKQMFGHKIRVKDWDQFNLIQEAVFEAGGKWLGIGKNYFTDYNCEWSILISTDGVMSTISCDIEDRWEKHPLPELVLETVKTLRIVETVPAKSEQDVEKENLQKVIDKLQQELQNAQQQLNDLGGN